MKVREYNFPGGLGVAVHWHLDTTKPDAKYAFSPVNSRAGS